MNFSAIAFDQTGKAACQDAIGLLDSFRGCSNGWKLKRPKLDENTGTLAWDGWTLKVEQVARSSEAKSSEVSSFIVRADGDYEKLEPMRLRIIVHLTTIGMRPVYILRDEVSEAIAGRLYLQVYRLENRLREYLTKFYSIIYGADFWPLAAAKLAKKADEFRGNERVFSEHADTIAYRITFDDLGGIVFKVGTNQPDVETLIDKLRSLPAGDADRLTALQSELEPNYERFFKGLKQGNFRKLWERFAYFRNKIAHNNLFVADDETEANEVYAKLMELISQNDKEIETIKSTLEASSKSELQEELLSAAATVPDSTPSPQSPLWVGQGSRFVAITREEFLAKLEEIETEIAQKGRGYIGLKRFIEFHLGALGFDYKSAWQIYEALLAEGKIERYEVQSNYSDYPSVAIRSSVRPRL